MKEVQAVTSTPEPEPEPEPTVEVTETGGARATGEGTAVTGYRAPAPRGPLPGAGASTQVSGTGDATASGGGIANTGIFMYIPPRREPVTFPHQVGVLPTKLGYFQDRAAVSALREAVAGGGTAVVCQILAGMGGVGKTHLAADHARRAWRDEQIDLLVWVTATSRQAVIDAYAQAAADVLCADPADPEGAARTFLAWLEPKPALQAPRWLIVLDDVADPRDLNGLWPTTHAHGRTLVTTRHRDAAMASHGRLVPVGLFTPAEATAYLQKALAAHGRRESAADLAALADDLGYLPLALSQAAAYLINTHLDAATYRTRLADRTRQLPDLLPESLPDDQPTTVAAAWSLSLDRADQLRPPGLAKPMLQLAAMLDPNGIPDEVLTSAPALAHLTAHQTAPGGDAPAHKPPALTAEEATGALWVLHHLSLIDHDPDTPHQAVRVHQLIQRAIRDPLAPDQHDQLARTAADALLAAWPEIERDTGLAQALRANTIALTACAEDALYHPDVHTVLYRTGHSLGEADQGTAAARHFMGFREADDQVVAAIEYFHHLTDTTDHHLGPDHLDTLTARAGLAHWRGEAGDAAGAAAAFAALLEDYLRVLGPDHPDTLTARAGLARWWGEAGDAAGAAAATTSLLEDRVRVLGPDHPHTLTARGNLAHWREKAGDAAGAAAALAALLEDYLRVLGPDHPDTFTARGNLAHCQGRAGDPAGAAAAFASLLEDRVRVLGPDHHFHLLMNNVFHWRRVAGEG